MAYTFSVNNTPATGSVAMYTLASTLIAAGWTMPDASDGTTRAANQITTGASGSGGLGNNSAWMRLKAPITNGGAIVDQQREITIQRGTTNLAWRIKYSASTGFTTGGSTTTTPSSTDQVIILGTGTDASPTYNSWMAADGGYRWHVSAGGSTESYSFVAWAMISSSTSGSTAFALDVMTTGSFPTTDVDPAVTYISNADASRNPFTHIVSTPTTISTVANPSLARTWLGYVSAAEALTNTNSVNVQISTYGTNVVGGGGNIGTNPFSSKDDMLPALWIRGGGSTSPTGMKGFSTLFFLTAVPRTNMDTYDVGGTRDRVYVNYLSLPWSGAVPTI